MRRAAVSMWRCAKLGGVFRVQLTMRRKWAACLIAAGLVLACSPATARDYEVEVIVFDRLEKESRKDANANRPPDEQWDFSSPRIEAHLRRMALLDGNSSEHETTDAVAELESVRAALVESGYRILNTTRWRQPGSFYQHAPLIPLGAAGTALASGFVRVYTTSLIYADLELQFSPLLPVTAPPASTGSDPVADAISVVKTNTGANINADTGTADPPPHYFITEKRRLKFGQIHYFDHPYFGAILGIWPAADEVPSGDEATSAVEASGIPAGE